MSERDPIRIARDELFTATVEEALARQRALEGKSRPEPPTISPLRRFLYDGFFYLPVAGVLGAFLAWSLIEAHLEDFSTVAGPVGLIETDAPAVSAGATSLTVGSTEIIVGPWTKLEKGERGEPPLTGIDAIQSGTLIEAVGIEREANRIAAFAVRPAMEARAARKGVVGSKPSAAAILFFPLTATLIAVGLLLAEGLAARNWVRLLERTFLGTLLAVVFCFVAFLPGGVMMTLGHLAVSHGAESKEMWTVRDVTPIAFVALAACRSVCWSCLGAAIGLGMNLVRSTRTQLRNSVLGGALGGAVGGLFFDPIDRFVCSSIFQQADASRLVGVLAVGLCIGIFVALVERLSREAWIRVRTGPLAGKSFVLYRTPTRLGSSPRADIYLFKDAEIDPDHAAIHRVGASYEIEDLGSRMGTQVGGHRVRRRRLSSGDQIVLGGTVVEFEERAKQPAPA